MSKLLVIVFDNSDLPAAAGFAAALGAEASALLITGNPTADVLAKELAGRAAGFTHIAAVSSMQSKDVMARLAALIDAAMVTDVVKVNSPTSFDRPIIAGSVVATVETLAEPVVITFRPAGFVPGDLVAGDSIATAPSDRTQRTSESSRGTGRPDLSQAKVVVSGGRPLGDAATFERVIGGLADKLGGAVGATRAAVDSGIAANELQVGQTGKIVAPDLYIAAGISGSTQHMAGIKDSKVIVAINKDADAPIFEVADFGLVADLFDAVPELTSKV